MCLNRKIKKNLLSNRLNKITTEIFELKKIYYNYFKLEKNEIHIKILLPLTFTSFYHNFLVNHLIDYYRSFASLPINTYIKGVSLEVAKLQLNLRFNFLVLFLKFSYYNTQS